MTYAEAKRQYEQASAALVVARQQLDDARQTMDAACEHPYRQLKFVKDWAGKRFTTCFQCGNCIAEGWV